MNCGQRASKRNNVHTKEQLVEIARRKGLLSAYAANKMKKADLCKLLEAAGIIYVDVDCAERSTKTNGVPTLAELVERAVKFHGFTVSQAKALTKAQLCKLVGGLENIRAATPKRRGRPRKARAASPARSPARVASARRSRSPARAASGRAGSPAPSGLRGLFSPLMAARSASPRSPARRARSPARASPRRSPRRSLRSPRRSRSPRRAARASR